MVTVASGGCGSGSSRGSQATTTVVPPARRPSTTVKRTNPSTTRETAPPTTRAPAVASSPAVPGSCHVRGTGLYVLPDPACTPGATYAGVSQANIDATICTSGWTSTIRPPESYTEPLKYEQMAAYGDTGSAGDFEEDHLIPLELGGSPTSPQNLWPEPGPSPNPKDAVEDAANHAVCDGRLTLAAARQAIASNWIALGRELDAIAAPPASSGSDASCSLTASYSAKYQDYDVYVHSNQPDETLSVTTSGGSSASWHTDGAGYADVYLHTPGRVTGERVTATVGGATCASTLP
jgi:hypothetical protein